MNILLLINSLTNSSSLTLFYDASKYASKINYNYELKNTNKTNNTTPTN